MSETSKKLTAFVTVFIFVNLVTWSLWVLPTFGDENLEWKEVYNKKGSRVETNLGGSGLKQLRVETVLDAPIEVLYEIISDPATWKDWFAFCGDSKNLKKINENTLVWYVMIDLPFPFRDRDGVMSRKLEKNVEEGTCWIEVEMIPDSEDDQYGMDVVTKEKKRVRPKNLIGNCKLIRLSPDKTKVLHMAGAEINIFLPDWFINWFAAIQPLGSIKGIKKEMKKEIYYERAGVIYNKKLAGNK